MSVISKLSTRTKLILGFGFIALTIVVVVLQSYRSITIIIESETELTDNLMITRNLTQLRSDENRTRALALELMLHKDDAGRKETLAQLQDEIKTVDNRIAEIEKSLINYPTILTHFHEIEELLKQYRTNRQRQIELTDLGKIEEAIDFSFRIQEALYNTIRSKLIELEKELDQIALVIKAKDKEIMLSIITSLLVTGGIMVLISLSLMFWLRGMLARIFGEINDGMTILGTSASEILTTVTEVSTGATETATAVSETTVTIEEIRQTALLATQKAQSVLESSHRASEAAENGKHSVQQTIDGMDRISQQMKLISDSVGRLAEQSRMIGEITASVNDIADQSNLLAVNASIEAARAGEQGRGFTVVAREIRSLAEQSKKATAQVKTILNEIQKGMSLAVLATDQGSKTVEEGNRQAIQSGEIIDFLADTVIETAQSVIQISASSQQQMSGMDQIVPAMENIKQASEQNVIGTRQTQIAAHNLSDLGHNLKNIVEKYKF